MNINSVNFNNLQNIDSLPKAESATVKTPALQNQIEISDTSDIKFNSPKIKSSQVDKSSKTEPAPELIVMREKGLEVLVSMIDEAKKSIDLHIYIITTGSKELMDSLNGALERGVKIRLMVEDDPFYWQQSKSNPSEKAIEELVANGAEYKPDNPKFSKSCVTHEKSMIFDGKKGLILTGNLGASTFDKNLDLGAIVLENPKTVGQMKTIFNADWNRTPMPDLGETNLVLSPENAREKLTAMMGGAKQSIQILQQGFSDKGVIALLADKVQEGISTDITLTDPGIAQGNMQSGAYLALKGADVKFMVTPYIHAKAVGVDKRTEDSKTYVGSQNFSQAAIDKNRELGYIFHDKNEQFDGILEKYKDRAFEIPSTMVISDPSVIGQSLKSAIRTAEKEVIVQTNLFSEGGTRNALKEAVKNGCDVTVIMPSNPFPWDPNFEGNLNMSNELTAAGVKVIMSDPTYKAMQGTCVLIDGKESISFPDNISASAFRYNNSFGIISIGEKDVNDVKQLFESDLENLSRAELSPTSNIVASPGNARQKIENLINSAEESLKIVTKDFGDTKMIRTLQKKAEEGVEIFMIIGNKNLKPYEIDLVNDLKASGVHISNMKYENLVNNYIEIDKETAYVGSHSLNKKSLDETHGFGNIVSDPEMLRIARGKFSAHWLKASLQNAEKIINVEMSKIDFKEELKEDLISSGKRGVKIRIATNDFDSSFTKAEFRSLNKQIRKMAQKPAETNKDKQEIATFFGEPFNIEKGLAKQKKVAETLSTLAPDEEIFQGISNVSIKTGHISVDGKDMILLPSRDEEISEELNISSDEFEEFRFMQLGEDSSMRDLELTADELNELMLIHPFEQHS